MASTERPNVAVHCTLGAVGVEGTFVTLVATNNLSDAAGGGNVATFRRAWWEEMGCPLHMVVTITPSNPLSRV